MDAEKRAKKEERLKKLDEQAATIRSAKRKIRGALSKDERKADTRKKILIGAMIQDMVKQGGWEQTKFLAAMDRFLAEDRDRALFGLPPRPPQPGNP